MGSDFIERKALKAIGLLGGGVGGILWAMTVWVGASSMLGCLEFCLCCVMSMALAYELDGRGYRWTYPFNLMGGLLGAVCITCRNDFAPLPDWIAAGIGLLFLLVGMLGVVTARNSEARVFHDYLVGQTMWMCLAGVGAPVLWCWDALSRLLDGAPLRSALLDPDLLIVVPWLLSGVAGLWLTAYALWGWKRQVRPVRVLLLVLFLGWLLLYGPLVLGGIAVLLNRFFGFFAA